MDKKPSVGLKILEQLHQKHPNNQGIKNSLINAYIRLGYHDIALNMIASIPDNKADVQSLKFKAWECHKNSDITKQKFIWQNIQKKMPRTEFLDKSNELIYRSTHEITVDSTDILLFCVEHNEILRLPYFLQHYRKLGINKFIFIDNNSDDGSFEFLLEQKDCYVFWTNNSHNESGSGVAWIQPLINKYALLGQWCLFADADEFLTYPNCESNGLSDLIQYLNRHDYELVSAYMLDMFPKSLQKQLSIQSGDNLIEMSPYFYNNYQFGYQTECPHTRPFGGIFSYYNISLTWLTKTSLFKKTENFRFLSATHASTPTNIASISSAYLHFKMIGDFQKKALQEVKRKEHAGGGTQYGKFANLYNELERDTDVTKLEKTIKYQNSQQLVDLGLIKSPKSWQDFIKHHKKT